MNLENNIINKETREKITDILSTNTASLEELKNICDIQINSSPPWSVNINCHAYALNLYNSHKYLDVATKKGDFTNGDFIKYLIKNNYLSELPDQKNPRKDCLVIYFDDSQYPKHSGIVESVEEAYIRVRSKWGIRNALIFHRLWDVPCQTKESNDQDYGTYVKYYYALNQQQAEEYFLKYIQHNES